jgi:hypothetical protein
MQRLDASVCWDNNGSGTKDYARHFQRHALAKGPELLYKLELRLSE